MRNQPFRRSATPLVKFVLVLGLAVVLPFASLAQAKAAEWYKGAIHQHTFWSDGNVFPEEVAAQYKELGYNFAATSDHNILQKGEHWAPVIKLKKRCGEHFEALVEKCNKRFGDGWVNLEGSGDTQMVRLKNFDEISAKLNDPGKFLYMWAEETNIKIDGKELHMNYINLADLVRAPKAEGETDTIIKNAMFQVDVAKKQAEKLGRPVLLQLNHPSWPEYDVSAENIAGVEGLGFLEVWNMGGDCKVIGDGKHPSCEKLWDIANTIRLQEMKQAPLYGTATDDCHNYISDSPKSSQPGRGFVVVRSEKLEANSLVNAMLQGDYYASTGVMLKDVSFDPATKTLRVEVDPKADTNYTIEFIGTRRGTSTKKTDATPDGYSAKIGEVFKTVKGTSAEYQMTGDELYVRAAIRSDRKFRRASPCPLELQLEEALTQPVGFEVPAADAKATTDTLPEPPAGKVWKLAWHDEFEGTELDTSKWEAPDCNRRTDRWSPEAVVLDGKGNLLLQTLPQKDGKHRSGCVRTRRKFEHAFGYYVARIRLQSEPGHWTAFWLFNDSVNKVGGNSDEGGRDGTEIDIMEKPWRDDRVQQTLHWDGYGEAHRSEGHIPKVPGVMEGYHTFSLYWTPEEYVFYVDGKETWRTKAGGVCQVPLYLKLSDEIGPWGGDIKDAKLPDDFAIDYVRVYDLVDQAK